MPYTSNSQSVPAPRKSYLHVKLVNFLTSDEDPGSHHTNDSGKKDTNKDEYLGVLHGFALLPLELSGDRLARIRAPRS
jgi:hypothetical protein